MALVVVAVVPFAVLIGCGLWLQWHGDQEQAKKSAMIDARLVANQLDDQLSNFESLLTGLSRAVSTDPAEARANDAMLRQVTAELPPYVNSIMVLSLDGAVIGTSRRGESWRIRAGERDYFHRILAGERLAISEPIYARSVQRWVAAIARPVEDRTGKLGAVLVLGIVLDRFQDALRVRELPDGGVIQVVNEHGNVVTRSVDNAS